MVGFYIQTDLLDYIYSSGADLFSLTETWLNANDTAAKLEFIPPGSHHPASRAFFACSIVAISSKTLHESSKIFIEYALHDARIQSRTQA